MQVHGSGAGHLCQKQALASEKRIPEPADKLNVVVHRWREGDEGSCIDAQSFARLQMLFDDRAARVNESQPIAGQPLKDESFAAEQSAAQLARKGYLDVDSLRRAQEGVLLDRKSVV